MATLLYNSIYFHDGTELVIKSDTLIGVRDADSPTINRFDAEDLRGMEALAAEFINAL